MKITFFPVAIIIQEWIELSKEYKLDSNMWKNVWGNAAAMFTRKASFFPQRKLAHLSNNE